MKKLKLLSAIILGVVVLAFILIRTPVPLTTEQVEYDNAIISAQKYKSARKCDQSLKILNTLKEEYPSTEIYIELEMDGCLSPEETFNSCLNSKLTEYMPTRAALCSKKFADAGKFDEAIAIWDKDIQDRPEEIFPYSQISTYEQKRLKLNMKLNSMKNQKAQANMTAELKAKAFSYTEQAKEKQALKKKKKK